MGDKPKKISGSTIRMTPDERRMVDELARAKKCHRAQILREAVAHLATSASPEAPPSTAAPVALPVGHIDDLGADTLRAPDAALAR